MRDATESPVENASLSIFVGKQPRLVERLSRVMKRGNTGARMRWDTTRKETNRRSRKENGRSNASCFSEGRMRRRKEVDGIYRCGSGIVCAWTDIRTVERRNWNVIWLGSHQDFILRSPLSFRSFLSRPIRTILIASYRSLLLYLRLTRSSYVSLLLARSISLTIKRPI